MAAPRIELYPRTPWVLRLFDRVPLPAFAVGVAIAATLFVLFLLYTTLLGAGPGTLIGMAGPHTWVAEVLQDLFFGLTLAIAAASVRGAVRDLGALLPALGPAVREGEALRRDILRYQPLPLALVALVSAIFSGVMTPLDPGLWIEGRFPGFTHPSAVWLAARNFLNWGAVGFAMGLELMLGRRFSHLGDHLVLVDLLDRARLEPFGRRALRNVSFWMLLAAFLALHYAGAGWAGELLPLALLVLATFAAAAFLLPLLGAHRRLRACKEAELAHVRGALLAAREQVLAPAAAGTLAGGRLADLVAYEARVAAASEWPIDASTVVRLGFYVALGLGSWVGAALVQELLGRALR